MTLWFLWDFKPGYNKASIFYDHFKKFAISKADLFDSITQSFRVFKDKESKNRSNSLG